MFQLPLCGNNEALIIGKRWSGGLEGAWEASFDHKNKEFYKDCINLSEHEILLC